MATNFSSPPFVWHPNDYRGLSWAVALVCLVLSISSLLARLWYRQHTGTRNIDDGPAAGLLVLVIACLGIQTRVAVHGLGLSAKELQSSRASLVSECLFADILLYFTAMGCSKLSLALTCKLTVLAGRRKRDRHFWTIPTAIVAVVLFGIIRVAAQLEPTQLARASPGQYASLRITFIIFLTLDALVDIGTIGLMGFEIFQLQMRATSRQRIMLILCPRLASIPVNVFLCRSIQVQHLADDFTLNIWSTIAFLALSLLVSSMSTAIIPLGRSLEGFDIRAQTDFAMSTLHSRRSPGHTKFSKTNSAARSDTYERPSKYERSTKIDAGDAGSDRMPILPEDADREGVIWVNRTVECNSEPGKQEKERVI